MKEQNNIEEVFKNAFDHYEVDPGANAWTNVQAGINSGAAASSASGAASTATASWVTTVVVGLAISAAAIGGYYLFNQHGEAKVKEAISQKSNKEPANITENNNNAPTEIAADKNDVSENSEANSTATQHEVAPSNQPTNKGVNTEKATATTNQNKENTRPLDTIANRADDTTNEVIESANDKSNNLVKSGSSKNTSSQEDTDNKSEATDDNAQNKSSTPDKTNGSKDNDFSTPIEDKNDKAAVHAEFPNVFTPNQDGVNDRFNIIQERSKGLDQIQEAKMIIKDNTGKTVAIWSGVNENWDGTLSNGSNAPDGKYLYQFTYTVGGKLQTPITGFIKLNR